MPDDIKLVLKAMRQKVENGDWPSDKDFKWVRGLITEDGQVSRDEAEALFTMKTMAGGRGVTAAFTDLFVQGLTSFLLFTGITPGSLDDKEWIWLSDHISTDGDYDELERALLTNIVQRAEKLPLNFPDLAEKFSTPVRR
jgi:hypothetical protein